MLTIFDVDGPLSDDNTLAFFRFVQEEKGLRWHYDRFRNTGIWEQATKLSPPAISVFYREFLQSPYFSGHRPTAGALKVLRRIPRRQRVIATNRHPEFRDSTKQFLIRHYGRFGWYHFSVFNKAAKLHFHQSQNFIDDNVHEVRVAAAAGLQAFLFPARDFQRDSRVKGVVMLEAETHIHPDMSDHEWRQTCEMAWEQIGDYLGVSGQTRCALT